MSILVDKNSKVLVQGMTGRLGRKQTKLMLDYGTDIVAGVSPGKGGDFIYDIPVYDTVLEAKENHEIDTSIIYVPSELVKDAAYEAIDAGIEFMVIITDWVAYHDEMKIKEFAGEQGIRYIGPNTPGIIVPDEITLGMISPNAVRKGKVGIVSRSGTLTGEIASQLTEYGIGQSVLVGLGGDPVVGMRMKEVVELLEEDDETDLILIIGEIGGTMEEETCDFLKEKGTKPCVGFIAGRTAPKGKKMGHAGAIVTKGRGTAKSKIDAFESAGVEVAKKIWDVPDLVKKLL
ncbi:MAG: succinate--CoA ligase subunit alpha [Thermoplasmatota archaeon]